MTTLIALQHPEWCLIAADSQITGNSIAMDYSAMGKIAKNGQYVVAAAGFVRGINLIQHSFVPPIPPKKNLDKFMVNRFIPELRKTFIESGYEIKSDGDPVSHDSEIIVAVNGIIYLIDDVYGLERNNNKLYCAGSGQDFALGAAFALGADKVNDYEEAIDILYRAVKSAIQFDINSGGKVQIALQKNNGETFLQLLDD